MNTKTADSLSAMEAALGFTKSLNHLTNKIHSTHNIDEIMLDVSVDICNLFNADRLTIYIVSEDKSALVSKVKTGLNAFKNLKLPIAEQSIAGYVALNKKMLILKDVYDELELATYSKNLRFMKDVDQRTAYRTKQMMVVPVVEADTGDLVGVVQLINNKLNQPFSAMLTEGAQELAETLAVAFAQRQQKSLVKSKYDYLVVDGVISAAEFEMASRLARRQGATLEDILLDEIQLNKMILGKALSSFFGVPYEPYKSDRIKPAEFLKKLPKDFLENNHWVPLEEIQDGILILTTDPERVTAKVVNAVLNTRTKLLFCVCTNREFKQTLEKFYDQDGDILPPEPLGDASDEIEGQEGEAQLRPEDENELVKLVNRIIVDAHSKGVSDIHIEPLPGKAKTGIRFRKDGSLLNYLEVPWHYRDAMVARIKIMCDLDISEKRKPQDGKIKFKKHYPGLDIELRVATIPSQGGVENIVMRILASGEPIPLDKMGFSERNLELLKNTVSKPYGLFFVCGPTGSGKTTTLHSILKHINTPTTKIWTAEDPVEITQLGLCQVQINKKAGLDFPTIMRSFLRADPDVIMVGEMRDQETVSTGIEASLTGHLVFSTLHTNSAPESIVRLLDMGMDPFNFADALLGILAQRLARRLCKSCKKPHVATQVELKSLIKEYAIELLNTNSWTKDRNEAYKLLYAEWIRLFANDKSEIILYEPVGCEKCSGTGYSGRVGLHELLIGTDALKNGIQSHLRVSELFSIALEEGMRTLKQDGIEKVLLGITDIHQVRAVCIK